MAVETAPASSEQLIDPGTQFNQSELQANPEVDLHQGIFLFRRLFV